MSGIYQNLLNPNNTPNNRGIIDTMHDYSHASEIFRTNNYRLAPKYKFLFHVYFEINRSAIQFPIDGLDDNVSILVKTIKLPSFTVVQQDLNQYNRKRVVQTKIRYDNIDITWHDDHSNVMRNLWYNYYTYYYGDSMNSSQVLSGQSNIVENNYRNSGALYDFTGRNGYEKSNPQLANQRWGFYGETSPGYEQNSVGSGIKPPFFKNIYIYGLSQHTATSYVLVNPLIVTFSHDTYAYADANGVMENRMTVSYEFVKYSSGPYNGADPSSTVPHFAETGKYDMRLSPNLSSRESRQLVPGNAGLINPRDGNLEDLSAQRLNSGVNKTNIAYNSGTTRNLESDVRSNIVNEQYQVYDDALAAAARNAQFNFPVYGQSGTSAGVAGVNTVGLSTPTAVNLPNGVGVE